jgi:hypothetical protein
MTALLNLGDVHSERLPKSSSTMGTTSISMNELWHIVAVTSNKLRITSSQQEHGLRRLALLYNTFDQNTSLLQSMMAASMIHDSKEETVLGDELDASSDEFEGSDVYGDVDVIYGVGLLVGQEEPSSQERGYS